jgi:alkaline phosphatase D
LAAGGGAVLYGNGDPNPILGNNAINQFLDNTSEVLNIRDWSSKRVAGPVMGYISDTTANVQFRVERTGTYRLQVFNQGSNTPLQTIDRDLEPAGVFMFTGLSPNTHYNVRLFAILNNQPVAVPNTDASFRTSPQEGTGVEFSFGIGSCLRNRDNTSQTVWQQIKDISLDPAIDIVNSSPTNNLRFFIHTGDTHYFFDDVAKSELLSLVYLQAPAATGHLSSRLNVNFLDMAKLVPTCAVWDDHDYRFNNLASDGLAEFIKGNIRDVFLNYWGNPGPFITNPIVVPYQSYGLSTRMSYGNVDIYLMDGRSQRIKSEGKFFGIPQIDFILQDIQNRGTDKLRIFASGSLWNHNDSSDDEKEKYGHSSYSTEREYFYSALNNLISQGKTKGVVFISGDIHNHELFEIKLSQSGTINVAPEFVCSPLGKNSGLGAAGSITGERKWSKSTLESDGSFWGYAQITVNTKDPLNISLRVQFRRYDNGTVFKDKLYSLTNNQFIY